MIEIRNGAIISIVPTIKATNNVVATNSIKYMEVRYVYQGLVYKRTLPLHKSGKKEYLDFGKTAHCNLGVVYV